MLRERATSLTGSDLHNNTEPMLAKGPVWVQSDQDTAAEWILYELYVMLPTMQTKKKNQTKTM